MNRRKPLNLISLLRRSRSRMRLKNCVIVSGSEGSSPVNETVKM